MLEDHKKSMASVGGSVKDHDLALRQLRADIEVMRTRMQETKENYSDLGERMLDTTTKLK